VPHPGMLTGQIPGMPAYVLSGGRVRVPGVLAAEGGTALYVIWTAEPDGVDAGLWERVPLSAYYAEAERIDAEEPR